MVEYLNTNETVLNMFAGINLLISMGVFLLAAVVVSSIMISDVNEQTYQFAMMRALGFTKQDLIVFIVL